MSVQLPPGATIPALGLGTFPLSGVFTPVDPAQAAGIIGQFKEAGGWYIETAPVYSPNAIDLGSILARFPRSELFIATKCVTGKDDSGATVRSGKSAHLRAQCRQELRRLQTDYLDLFQLHTVPEDATAEESYGTLRDLKSEGLVRNIGVSNVTLPQLQAFSSIAPVDFVQNRFSFIHRRQHGALAAFCSANGTLMNPYQVLERGLLTDNPPESFRQGDLRNSKFEYSGDVYHFIRAWVLNDVASLAREVNESVLNLTIGWAMSQEAIGIVPLGATSAAQLEANMAAPHALGLDVLGAMDASYARLERSVRDRFGLSVDEYRGL